MGLKEEIALRGLKTLVTGCSGLLGGWLTEELLSAGASVVGLDRDRRVGSRLGEFIDRIDFVDGDLEDFDLVLRVLNEFDVDFVFHLGAQAIVGVAARNPLSTFRSNVEGTWNVLEAARILNNRSGKIKGLIVASSDKAYGEQEELPYKEDAPMQGTFPYDVSKSCTDLISRSYFHSWGLPVCVTRCANLFGGGDLNWSRIVPGTIRHALRNERPVIRSDGSPVRDYLYVKDAADAIRHLGELMLEDKSVHGQPFNLSVEVPLSVLEITNKILTAVGREDLEPLIENTASLEIQKQYLSAEKFRKASNWKPQFGLEEALSETVEWYRHYFTENESVSGRTGGPGADRTKGKMRLVKD